MSEAKLLENFFIFQGNPNIPLEHTPDIPFHLQMKGIPS